MDVLCQSCVTRSSHRNWNWRQEACLGHHSKICVRFVDPNHLALHQFVWVLATSQGTIRTKHWFMMVHVVVEINNISEGRNYDHGNYLKDVKSTIDLSKVVTIFEDLLSLLLFHSLLKEYQLFKKLFIENDLLPPFTNLEFKLLIKLCKLRWTWKKRQCVKCLWRGECQTTKITHHISQE